MPIVWDSKLDTGIEVIDSQHRRIVGYINDLEVAKTKGDKALVTADSTLKCNGVMTRVYLLHKNLVWCFESEAFSWSVI